MIVILCIEFDLCFVYTSKMVLTFVKDRTMLDIVR